MVAALLVAPAFGDAARERVELLTKLQGWLAAQKPAHRVAISSAWPWLPTVRSGILTPHPYCTDCGQVRYVGTGRALDVGGLANLLSRLARFLREIELRLTEAQIRLILRHLTKHELADPFGLSRESQHAQLVALLSSCLGHPPNVVESYLRSC